MSSILVITERIQNVHGRCRSVSHARMQSITALPIYFGVIRTGIETAFGLPSQFGV